VPGRSECHLRLDSRDGAKQKKENGIGELCAPTIVEVDINHIAARDQKKYQCKLSFKPTTFSKDSKTNPEHIEENQ
jgi:hypothetical protein